MTGSRCTRQMMGIHPGLGGRRRRRVRLLRELDGSLPRRSAARRDDDRPDPVRVRAPLAGSKFRALITSADASAGPRRHPTSGVSSNRSRPTAHDPGSRHVIPTTSDAPEWVGRSRAFRPPRSRRPRESNTSALTDATGRKPEGALISRSRHADPDVRRVGGCDQRGSCGRDPAPGLHRRVPESTSAWSSRIRWSRESAPARISRDLERGGELAVSARGRAEPGARHSSRIREVRVQGRTSPTASCQSCRRRDARPAAAE